MREVVHGEAKLVVMKVKVLLQLWGTPKPFTRGRVEKAITPFTIQPLHHLQAPPMGEA